MTYLQFQCGECNRWTLALYPEKLCKECYEKAGGFKTSVMRREEANAKKKWRREKKRRAKQ